MLRANEFSRLEIVDRLIATAKDGSNVEFVEQFALGQGVTHPLLSLGRLLRQGWVLSRDQDERQLEHHERGLQIPARLERNSLVMEVQVCAIRSEEDEDVIMEEKDGEMPPEVAGSGEEKKNEAREEKVESPEVEHAEKMSKGDVTPGYTSEDTVQQVHDHESSDGRVQSRLARWNKKLQPVKKEPIELSPEDSQGVGEMCQGVIAEGQPKFVNRPWILGQHHCTSKSLSRTSWVHFQGTGHAGECSRLAHLAKWDHGPLQSQCYVFS